MVMFPKRRYNPEQKQRLLELIKLMRYHAVTIGPQHSWWDVISDMECFLEGANTVLDNDAEGWIAYAEKTIHQSIPQMAIPPRRLPVKIQGSWSVEKGRWKEGEGFVDRHTDHFFRDLEMVIEPPSLGKGAIIRFVGGPTGYESYYVEDLQRPNSRQGCNTFCICAGTINSWPRCEVPWADVVAFLKANGYEMPTE